MTTGDSSSILSKIKSNIKAIVVIIAVLACTHTGMLIGGCAIGNKKCIKASEGMDVSPTPKDEKPPTTFVDPKKITGSSSYTIDRKAKLSADQVAKLYAAYNKAPIVFSHKVKGKYLYVTATDMFQNEKGKVKTATMKYTITPMAYKHTIGFAPGILMHYDKTDQFTFMYGGELYYMHRWGPFALGAGVPVYVGSQKEFSVGANIKLEYSW